MNFCAHTAEENVRTELPCNHALWLKFVLPSQQAYRLEPDCCTTNPFLCQIWAGAEAGSKLEEAQPLDIRILDEAEFLKMCGTSK